MNVAVEIVNAFVDGESGGNPAGVVLEADGLNAEQKLAVARQVGLSETAFVSASEVATIRLEFFTPNRQIAHCGHATIATFARLHQLGRVEEGWLSKETIDGNRDILVRGALVFMEQRAPRYTPLPPGSELYRASLASLGIGVEQLLAGYPPCVVNTGNSFLLLALKDDETLGGLQPNLDAIAAVSDELDLIGYYPFCLSTQQPGRAAAARMFAPRYEIPEEAATGMAAGPLACYLHDYLGAKETTVFIEQGRRMPVPSPSVIQVDLEVQSDQIARLMAGGRARAVAAMTVDVTS